MTIGKTLFQFSDKNTLERSLDERAMQLLLMNPYSQICK